MTTRKPIFLKGDDTVVNLDGLEITIGELKNHVIDATMFRKFLEEVKGGEEA